MLRYIHQLGVLEKYWVIGQTVPGKDGITESCLELLSWVADCFSGVSGYHEHLYYYARISFAVSDI